MTQRKNHNSTLLIRPDNRNQNFISSVWLYKKKLNNNSPLPRKPPPIFPRMKIPHPPNRSLFNFILFRYSLLVQGSFFLFFPPSLLPSSIYFPPSLISFSPTHSDAVLVISSDPNGSGFPSVFKAEQDRGKWQINSGSYLLPISVDGEEAALK